MCEKISPKPTRWRLFRKLVFICDEISPSKLFQHQIIIFPLDQTETETFRKHIHICQHHHYRTLPPQFSEYAEYILELRRKGK